MSAGVRSLGFSLASVHQSSTLESQDEPAHAPWPTRDPVVGSSPPASLAD